MRPLHLSLSGFASYDDKGCELDLSDVVSCAVVGGNGTGKSSLFAAMLWSMFGIAGSVKQEELINKSSNKCRVEFQMRAADGSVHKFVREHKGGRGSSALYEGASGTLTKSGEISAQAANLLNADANRLLLTAWAPQGELGRFGSLGASERREHLTQIVVGGAFDGLAEILAEVKSETQEAVSLARHTVDRLEIEAASEKDAKAEVKIAEQMVGDAQQSVQEAEKELVELQGRALSADELEALALAKTAADKLPKLKTRLANAEAAKSKSEAALEDMKADAAQKSVAAEESEKPVERAQKAVLAATAELATSRAEAEGAVERKELLQRGDAECWTCGGDLSGGKAEELLAELDRSMTAETAARTKLKRATKKLSAAEDGARRASAESAKAERAVTDTENAIASASNDIRSAELDLADAEAKSAGLEELEKRMLTTVSESDMRQAERKLSTAKSDLSVAERRLGAANSEAARCEKARLALPDAERSQAEAALKNRAVEVAIAGARPAGIQHLVLSDRLSSLETAANAVLAGLGDLTISFETADPTKARPPLTVLAQRFGDSESRRYESLSGGEQARVDVALRVGLCKISDIRCRTLVMDEGWGALDEAGVMSLAVALQSLVERGDMEAVFTITHIPEAAAGFEHRIDVSRTQSGASQASIFLN